jgi:putative membrane protein
MTRMNKACLLAIVCSLMQLGCSSSGPSSDQTAAASTGDEAPPAAPTTAPASSPVPNPSAGPRSVPGPGYTIESEGQVLQILSDVDSAEIEQAKLAQSKAGNARVQHFAAQMISEHTASKNKGTQLAQTLATSPEPSGASRMLQAKALQTSENLKAVPAASFDRAYIQAQLDQHRDVLATINDQLLPAAKNDALRNQLGETQRMVTHHIEMATAIQRELAR